MDTPIVVIGIDPGQRGAIASCSTDSRSDVNVLFAEGAAGYYCAGMLGLSAAVGALTRSAENAGWDGDRPVVVVLEALGKWRTRHEGVNSTFAATRAHQEWRDAVELLGARVGQNCEWCLFERQTQWLDRNAGLKRTTKGGRNRKAEVALFVGQLAREGRISLSLDELIPPGMRTLSDGATDAILFMLAGCRVLCDGPLAGGGS